MLCRDFVNTSSATQARRHREAFQDRASPNPCLCPPNGKCSPKERIVPLLKKSNRPGATGVDFGARAPSQNTACAPPSVPLTLVALATAPILWLRLRFELGLGLLLEQEFELG